jgi:hypothetical protein
MKTARSGVKTGFGNEGGEVRRQARRVFGAQDEAYAPLNPLLAPAMLESILDPR